MESLVKMKHSVPMLSRSKGGQGDTDTDTDADEDKDKDKDVNKDTNTGHQLKPYQHHQSIIKVNSGQGLAT